MFSKAFEKVIHNQTREYLTDNNILYKYQSSFCKNTCKILHFHTTCILTGFDSGLPNGMFLIYFQKAFGTIKHGIFLRKMASLGFLNHSIMWIQSYLSYKCFQVNTKSKYSSAAKIECGVPQESILGSCFFYT